LFFPVNDPGWSLCFEMLFYAAMAVAIWTRKFWLPIAIFVVCWLARDALGWGAFHVLGNPMILEFLFGVAIAKYAPPLSPRMSLYVAALGFALIFASRRYYLNYEWVEQIYASGSFATWRVIGWGAPAALVVWGAIGLKISARPLIFLGDASYAIYLVHYLLFRALHMPAAAMFVFGFATGCALYVLADRPIQRWLAKLPNDRAVGRAVAVSSSNTPSD
jgi:exopolysaccharide production protein ExoZ